MQCALNNGGDLVLSDVLTTRIAIVSAVYPPEPVVSAGMSRDIARYLAKSSEVSVIVLHPPPSRPEGSKFLAAKYSSSSPEWPTDGINEYSLDSYTNPKSNISGRLLESFDFGRRAVRALRNIKPKPDAIYVNTWPMASQWMLASFCHSHDIPLIMHVMDLYPETLLARFPSPTHPFLLKMGTALDQRLAKRASRIVLPALSMRDNYVSTRELEPQSTTWIPSWVDDEHFRDEPTKVVAGSTYDVPTESFNYIFLGNIGYLAGVDFLISSFCVSPQQGTSLIIAGDGAFRRSAMNHAKSLGDENIYFVSDPEASATPFLLALGDVAVLPMKKDAGLSSTPSKLISYMLAGKPVVASVDAKSEAAELIRAADCGWVGPPEDQAWLSSTLDAVARLDPAELAERGRRGQAFAKAAFSRSVGIARMVDLIKTAASMAVDGKGK